MSTNTPSPAQTFALSMFANAVQSVTGDDLAAEAHRQIDAALGNMAADPDPEFGSWKIIWGPVVLSQQVNSAHSVNLMYGAQNSEDPTQIVVAIAGTNFAAVIDSVIEDCFVGLQVPWMYSADAQGAKISFGAAVGLFNLQNLVPEAAMPGAGVKLVDFLAGLDLVSGALRQKLTITVAGHSLGGALAAVVALWLADTQQLWDPGANATIAAHTFAGPTAGNRAFASRVGEQIGELAAFYNTLDVIPHAWREGSTPPNPGDPPSLSQLPGIYVANIPPDDDAFRVLLLIGVFKLLAAGGDYETLPRIQAIEGTFSTDTGGKAKPDSFDRYLAQLGYQHIGGYYTRFKYDAKWMSRTPQTPQILSPSLASTLRAASSPSDVVKALQDQKPQKIAVAGADIEVPRDPGDPRAVRAVAALQAALAQQGKRSPAT